MESTKNYKKFRFLDTNREILDSKLEELINSIKQKNLLEFRPILVDETYAVIDGQHRLKAAERLGLEIYYQVKRGASTQDMLLLNANQSAWGWKDFMKAYCAEGNENYLKLRAFMEKYNLSLRAALAAMDFNSRLRDNGASFKNGTFEFPKDEDLVKFKVECLLETCDFIKAKTLEKFDFRSKFGFCYAFLKFMNIESMDYNVFKKKLAMRLDQIHKCITSLDYLRLFISIYNYKNTSPLGIDLSKIYLNQD